MKKLYRSNENRIIGGVDGGLGEYFNLDPIFFKIGFFLANFMGLVVYVVLLLTVPLKDLKHKI